MEKESMIHINTNKFSTLLSVAVRIGITVTIMSCMIAQYVGKLIVLKYDNKILAIIVGAVIYLCGEFIIHKYKKSVISFYNKEVIKDAHCLEEALVKYKIVDKEQLQELLEAITSSEDKN